MRSIIKDLKTTDIRELSVSDFEEALFYVNSGREKIKKLSDKVRKIILGITELSRMKKIDLYEKDLGNKLIQLLRNSDDFIEVGLGKVISEVLFHNPDLEKLAYYDQETGLPNRFMLEQDVENGINGNGNGKIVVLLKMEGLANINSMCGHDCGTEVLKAIIYSLKLNFENVGFKLYRESGITFGLVKDVDSTHSYEEIIEYINNFIKNYYVETSNLGKIPMTSSAVINAGEKIKLEKIAKALEEVKIHDILVFNSEKERELQNKLIERDEWREEVKDALNTGRIIPYYQGIHNNRMKEITRYEALVRLKKGDKIIPPGVFLKHINGTSLIKELSKTMIKLVIEKMKNTNYNFSINLTESDLIDENILNLINNELIKNQVKPSRLTIEILEEIGDLNGLFLIGVNKFKDLGLKIAIDDFGTGYNGLLRIFESKPDIIKIDGSLIRGIVTDEKKRKLLELIVKISNIMGSEIIAEYVENAEIQEIVTDLGIKYSQGYYHSIPSAEIKI